MKKLFFLALLLFSQTFTFAQNDKLLVGNWVYAGIDQEDIDEETQQMADQMFKDLSLTFSADHKMSFAAMGKSETGSWELDKADANKVVATSDKGKTMEMIISGLTETELKISIGKMGGALKLKRKPE